MLSAETQPFVLLDDARPGGAAARLYRRPVRTIEAQATGEIAAALDEVRQAGHDGLHAAGFLSYAAGAAFEPAAGPIDAGDVPLLWFGLFENAETLAADEVPAHLPAAAGAWIGALADLPARADYDRQFGEVLALIAAGDLYQANLSFRASVPVAGDALAIYAAGRARAAAGWGGIVATGRHTLLSFSPEQFFVLEDGRLTCRPMKGTARRGDTPAADDAAATWLGEDPKQRAENLMIVDLMRNDLSRVARPGSVAVPELFAVERYPTVHQMVSSVTAELAAGRDAVDVLAATFPCGSITGAPKVRAMQAIERIEDGAARGVYTGSIGRIDPGGDAAFNVAIRTLTIDRDAHAAVDRAAIGLGSGIVADSRAADEWDECLAKAAFLAAGQRSFDLIETMAFDPEEGVVRLERHLARLKASAERFGFAFDRHAARNELQAATFRLRSARRLRLVLSSSGTVAIEVAPLPAPPPGPLRVRVVALPVAASDFRLRHKTSDRRFYDDARRGADADEVVFADADGRLTEGSFTSLFVPRGDVLVTPPLARGLLPGVLRAELIEGGRAIEGDLVERDLVAGFFVGNALRGLMPAVAEPRRAPL